MDTKPLDRLLPRPRSATAGGSTCDLPPTLTWAATGASDSRLEAHLERALATVDRRLERAPVEGDGQSAGADVLLVQEGGGAAGVPQKGIPPQGYSLHVRERARSDDVRPRIEIRAADARGIYYGIRTLEQWLTLHRESVAREARVATLEVQDAPDFSYRGLMLDISRNRVPTMETLRALVAWLASLKFNQLQLYVEHTFAYDGHEVVWKDASPLTAEEMRWLDQFCYDHFIELVPNQNSFGHLHRWLIHEPYRQLAECPDGIEHPFSPDREPFSLCPTDPHALALLEDLYGQLLPNFRSTLFNVGLDETFDLGRGRSADECREKGPGQVYLEWLRAVCELVARHDRRTLFWADMLLEKNLLGNELFADQKARQKAIEQVPRDAIALIWGYEAGHDFAGQTRTVADTGLEHWVCPGTSSWNSATGRTANALANIHNAAIAGQASGATGILLTDWGDFGHLQPEAISWPGLLAAAEFGWCLEGARAPEPDTFLDALLTWAIPFAEPEPPANAADLARAILELGALSRRTGAREWNGSALFYLFVFPDTTLDHRRFEGLDTASLAGARAAIALVRQKLGQGTYVERSLDWAARLADLGARLGLARLANARKDRERALSGISAGERGALRESARTLQRDLPGLWRERSRPGGLDLSSAWFDRFCRALDRAAAPET